MGTRQLSDVLGVHASWVAQLLCKRPELRPKTRFGNALVWGDEDIARLKAAIASLPKPGRPRKNPRPEPANAAAK